MLVYKDHADAISNTPPSMSDQKSAKEWAASLGIPIQVSDAGDQFRWEHELLSRADFYIKKRQEENRQQAEIAGKKEGVIPKHTAKEWDVYNEDYKIVCLHEFDSYYDWKFTPISKWEFTHRCLRDSVKRRGVLKVRGTDTDGNDLRYGEEWDEIEHPNDRICRIPDSANWKKTRMTNAEYKAHLRTTLHTRFAAKRTKDEHGNDLRSACEWNDADPDVSVNVVVHDSLRAWQTDLLTKDQFEQQYRQRETDFVRKKDDYDKEERDKIVPNVNTFKRILNARYVVTDSSVLNKCIADLQEAVLREFVLTSYWSATRRDTDFNAMIKNKFDTCEKQISDIFAKRPIFDDKSLTETLPSSALNASLCMRIY